MPTGTRDRLIRLLREESRPVGELAEALGITPNAVRSQLAVLERDGFVRVVGERRGTRRPFRTYGLAPEAERLLSRAYAPVLRAVLDTLAAKSAPEELEGILRESGQRLAQGLGLPSGDVKARAAKVLQVLRELGGAVEVEEAAGGLLIRGHGCLLADAVDAQPATCKCMEAFLSEMLGTAVRERCERDDRPRCTFEVALEGGSSAPERPAGP